MLRSCVSSTTPLFFLPFIRFAAVAAKPSPVSLNFGTDFFGADGFWSAAQIHVGSPEQYIWVLPSTINSDTWLISPGGCDASQECARERGGLFSSNDSATFQSLGRFDLTSSDLDLVANYGDYGLDRIAISDTVSIPNQVIATVTTTEIWLGQLGLSVEQPRFNGTTDYLSLISTLVQNESGIPSHSYGYTAGAHYALKSVPGSLVLGGVDDTRFTFNNSSFILSPGYAPQVAIQGVTVTSSQSQGLFALPSNWDSNPLTLMPRSPAGLFTIDTSTPFLWMPPAVCDAFASALNLTYDEDLELYMYPNTTNQTSGPQDLNDWDLSFTFSLANSIDDTVHHELSISYNAFNLQLSYGFPNLGINYGDAPINYFPLRRANSSTQYTIGRAFLQEAYLMVDYERNTFSMYPAVFPDTSTVLPNIVPITRPEGSQWPGPQSYSASLSPGAKAGIGVGVALVTLILLAVAFVMIQRRKRVSQAHEKAVDKQWYQFWQSPRTMVSSTGPVSELLGDRRHPRELLVDSSATRFELPGRVPVEMPAGEVSENFLTANVASIEALTESPSSDSTNQAELSARRSIRKDYNIRTTLTERASSPAPPYPTSENGQNTSTSSEGVSPFGSKPSDGFGTNSSSGAAISPIRPHDTRISLTDDLRSAVSSRTSAPRVVSSHRVGPGTPSRISGAALEGPDHRSSQTTNRDSRFREELMDDDRRISETQEEQSQLRERFSWEQ